MRTRWKKHLLTDVEIRFNICQKNYTKINAIYINLIYRT